MLTISQFIQKIYERTGKSRADRVIRKLIANKSLIAEKCGRDWVLPESEVDRYINDIMQNR